MKPKLFNRLFPDALVNLAWLAFLQFILAGIWILTISADPKNTTLLGFSAQRLALVGGTFAFACLCLVGGFIAVRKKLTLLRIATAVQQGPMKMLLPGIIVLLALWLFIFSPAYLFSKSAALYERFQPFSAAFALSVFEFWLALTLYFKQAALRSAFGQWRRADWLPVAIFAAAAAALGIFIGATRIGLVLKTAYWNVPGIPLSSLQLFVMLVVLGVGLGLAARFKTFSIFGKSIPWGWLISGILFAWAVIGWGSTPMLKHYFSLTPAPPDFQPYPFSDARFHDLGSLSILQGTGVNFREYVDKPFYMVFLAVLHLVSGNDYTLLAWLQIVFLAVTPVVLFYFGKKFHSLAFGVFLAAILIIRQQNSITLSYKIASVNPRLLMSEMLTLVGVVLFTYLVFMWFTTQKSWLGLLAGGVCGAVSLVRLNPIFLFPAAACLLLVVYWKLPKITLAKHMGLYTLGFVILMLPSLLSGTGPDGTPWILKKIRDVIDLRYSQVSSRPTVLNPGLPTGQTANLFSLTDPNPPFTASQGLNFSPPPVLAAAQEPFTFLLVSHFLHNISTSVLALPDSLVFENLDTLSKREYWQDGNQWQGEFGAAQAGLILVNLALLALGLGYSWRRCGWAGLLPLGVFLTYCGSLGLAVSSGSRYIVPIDWIVFFYYALALVLIFEFVLGIFKPKTPSALQPPSAAAAAPASERRAGLMVLAVLIFLASAIPFANFVVPGLVKSNYTQAEKTAVLQSIPSAAQNSENWVYGEVHYPYLQENDQLDFNVMTELGGKNYSLRGYQRILQPLRDGQPVVLRLRKQDGKDWVEAVYQVKDAAPSLIWEERP